MPRQRFEPASGPGTLSGLAVEIDDEIGAPVVHGAEQDGEEKAEGGIAHRRVGRPGRLRVELQLRGETVTRVRVGGSAVTVLAGSIAVPDA